MKAEHVLDEVISWALDQRHVEAVEHQLEGMRTALWQGGEEVDRYVYYATALKDWLKADRHGFVASYPRQPSRAWLGHETAYAACMDDVLWTELTAVASTLGKPTANQSTATCNYALKLVIAR